MKGFIGSGRALSTGAGVYHPPGMWMCSPTQKFSGPSTFGIFMEASSGRHDQLLTQCTTPLPSPENGR